MISAGEFRNGITLEYNGQLYTIIEFQHVKPGKGAAFVRSKLKNIITGSVLEETFRPTEKMPRAHIERRDMQYLYKDDDLFHFMDAESFEQMALNSAEVGDSLKYVRENDTVKFMSHNGKVFGIEPGLFAELKVVETEPGFAGNTAQGVTKPATVETGAIIAVPLFVNIGDIVKIDSRTDEYLGRVQQ
ncbi:MAG: elongation factor P [Defluviitaleaceae bacterium]|nr:elongation factor P [Defluviitaleaceae bacterium]